MIRAKKNVKLKAKVLLHFKVDAVKKNWGIRITDQSFVDFNGKERKEARCTQRQDLHFLFMLKL